MDILSIQDLKVTCIVGVHPHERKREQDLFLDVELWMDLSLAARSDHLSDTVDYTRVAEDLSTFIRAERFQLIETLAHRASERLLDREPCVLRCRLTIRKPAAMTEARCASIQVEKERL